jgi:hypothetical protein
MAQCGDKPKRIAFGVAPLGIISIGIVPMGVVSIGVVPMGVLVAGVNVMGVWWAGLEGMGPQRLGAPAGALHQHHHGSPGQTPQNLMAYPTREEALEQARKLGCSGVHAMGSLWMPCSEHPE